MQRDDQYRDRWAREGGQRDGGPREDFSGPREGFGEGYYGQRRWQRDPWIDEDRWSGDRGGRYGQSRGDDWEQNEYSRNRGPSHHRRGQYGYGQAHPGGPQYEQGGRYPGTRPYGDRQWLGRDEEYQYGRSGGAYGDDEPPRGGWDQWPEWEPPGRGRAGTVAGESGEYGGYGGYGRGGMRGHSGRRSRMDPKGYTRSDERVREHVCEHLSGSGLDVRDVEVQVKDGQVTLQGQVPDRRTKHAVEDCADDCAGVKDVENRLKVRTGDVGETHHGSGTSAGAGAGRQAPGQHT
ncbi:BON domain-containing protein [Castellaniella ginsengisoli]|uniref:BON domain-containing protein n=1 Tax=Castellaniella ginsengisoli TaxID=546114 RepID=A0AB39CI24_9BURK